MRPLTPGLHGFYRRGPRRRLPGHAWRLDPPPAGGRLDRLLGTQHTHHPAGEHRWERETKGQAEILRARFDRYFRSTHWISSETGFLEVAPLNTPKLFQPTKLEEAPPSVKVEVSGVDVWRLLEWVSHFAKPHLWLIEADFETRSDHALLALRLRRGPRVIRTWYLDRVKSEPDDSAVLEDLSDDAIFQILYDFWMGEKDPDLHQWWRATPHPNRDSRDRWPSPAAVGAYVPALGGLNRFYELSEWSSLDAALADLRFLRGQMPESPDGLQLLGVALVERGEVNEAIHVYEHLQVLLEQRKTERWRALSIRLLKATVTARLLTWQSAHQAVGDLMAVKRELDEIPAATLSVRDRAQYHELYAHCAAQLGYTFALSLEYLQRYTVVEVFKRPDAPEGFRLSNAQLAELAADAPPGKTRDTIVKFVQQLKKAQEHWIETAEAEEAALTGDMWTALGDEPRRRSELGARVSLAKGCGKYRMAEWERSADEKEDLTIFGATSEELLREAREALGNADSKHPNHYRVLQLLGLASSGPRAANTDLSLAEQGFDRATRANPFDPRGHELLANALMRRVANHGIDWTAKGTIRLGLEEAGKAVKNDELSYTAHLLRAELKLSQLLLETDPAQQEILRGELDQFRAQARRLMPITFGRDDLDLAWVDLVSEVTRVAAESQALERATARPDRLRRDLDGLRVRVVVLEGAIAWQKAHWIPNQRRQRIAQLEQDVHELQEEMARSPAPEDWLRQLRTRFP